MYIYRLVTVLVIGIFLISPIIIDWWIASFPQWHSPWQLWLILIITSLALQKQSDPDEI